MKLNKDKRGFTLLEIIFALAILTIGLVGVLALFPTGLRASKRGSDFTTATFLAQQMLEQIKRGGFTYATLDTNSPTNQWCADERESTDPPFENAFAPPDDGFAFSVVQSGIGISNLNQVTCEIYWVDRGAVRSEQFITYLANYQ